MLIHFLFFCFVLLISSKDIIRDLPYNIYHIEDMNQYENKYIPEGNKYYIRFPYNINDNVKFSLSLPKNITLFPLYLATFSKYPSDKEISNTNFNNELELRNREDFHYSIYSYDLKNSAPYKVLYFKNNEILNYISLYASSISNSSNIDKDIVIKDIGFKVQYTFKDVSENNSYFIRVKIEGNEKKILIKTNALSQLVPIYSLDITDFNSYPENSDLTNLNNYKVRGHPYDSSYESRDEVRKYTYKSDNNIKYLGIHINAKKNLTYIDIIATVDSSFPVWAIILIIIGIAVVISIGSFLVKKFCR